MKKLIIALFCSAVSFSALAGGNIENGKALTEKYSCFACHGKDYNSPIDPSYPKLAGQHKDYLQHALTAYKRGDAPNGRSNAIMTGQVKALTNKDIQDIAAYLHSLPGSLVLKR
ncbi:cytochrome c [Duganella sp. Root1480D1]|uniref:c-type cytochrome n=1 Tax=Duganella sp. Root1480D1 TaxID=1736471 RepID=UPI00070DD0E7|nr:cytochrome c [Duganella sp. Root1480D1]KQZ42519.1 cytochrome C [Duganella sp. Root1480D1]